MIAMPVLDYAKGGGTVTVVVQDDRTGAVLMVAHADAEAMRLTAESGEMHFRSRSRGPWRKGETSGNVMEVVSLTADCDGDAVLARVRPAGAACHTGAVSCFAGARGDLLGDLDALIAARMIRGGGDGTGYTGTLLRDRNLRLKKLGEESAELAVACADGDAARAAAEGADLLYHMMVALRAAGACWSDVKDVLGRRRSDAADPMHAGRP